MNTAKEAPQQYKQPSRKGKRAWRKNVDVSDVQAGLEEVRQEIIQGGIIAEKPSEALFTLDTTGSDAIQKSYNKLHKPLKADQILAQRSAVLAVPSHKRASGVTDGVIEPSSKKRKTNGVSPKEYARLRAVAYGAQSVNDIIKNDGAPAHDPWAEDAATAEPEDPRFDYLEKIKPIRAPGTLKEAPISLVAGAKAVPAVAKPKPGTSYNPVFQDWDALITAEGAKEVEAEKKRLQEARLEEEKAARIAASAREAERDEGAITEDESAWEGFESDYEGHEWLGKKRAERKTPTQRKKVERRKEKERLEKWEKKEKGRLEGEKRIGALKKEVERKMQGRERARQVVGELAAGKEVDESVLRRRKLGKDALPEAPLELVLPEELRDSLRLLKPEGNLLKERFRNILLSGKMETRKPIQQARKKRRTYTDKWSYKDWVAPRS